MRPLPVGASPIPCGSFVDGFRHQVKWFRRWPTDGAEKLLPRPGGATERVPYVFDWVAHLYHAVSVGSAPDQSEPLWEPARLHGSIYTQGVTELHHTDTGYGFLRPQAADFGGTFFDTIHLARV